jgi:hypothetical protein
MSIGTVATNWVIAQVTSTATEKATFSGATTPPAP